jgi:hypothetical protein
MDVKDAVKKAIQYVAEIFESEGLENLGLEEVFLNESDNVWEVTVGFSRPWDHPKTRAGLLASAMQGTNPTRQYKIVTIDNATEDVKSIKIREIKNA